MMKKVLTIVSLLQFCGAMFAVTPDIVPTDAELLPYKGGSDNVLIALYTEAEVCNDIVWAGSYNGWDDSDPAQLVHFQPLPAPAGWYVCSYYDASDNISGKAVQLKNDGSFNWDYQWGDDVTLLRGTVDISLTVFNEADATHIGTDAPVVFASGKWKNNNSPCGTTPNATNTIYYTSIDGNIVTPARSDAFGGAVIVSNTYTDGQGAMVFDQTLTNIQYAAFKGCTTLASVIIPGSVTNIDTCVFSNCSALASIAVAADNPVYDSRDNCNAIINTASNTLNAGCINTTIPSSVTAIEWGAFAGRSGLTSITIPHSVTSIVETAFSGCTGLTSIICHAEEPPYLNYWGYDGGGSFYLVPRSIPLYVPASALAAYQVAAQWSEFDVQALLVEPEYVAPDSTTLSWMPVDSAAVYQLRIYSEQIALDTTLYINADAEHGGILSPGGAAAPQRQHRIVLDDEVGTLVVIVVDFNSGSSLENPFMGSVFTNSGYKIDVRYDMQVYNATNTIIRQENGMFTLNDDAEIHTALEAIPFSTVTSSASCYDLYGHQYPLAAWSSLPSGIYILRHGAETKKLMKQ